MLFIRYAMLAGIVVGCSTQKPGHETLTDVPPLDLRRDELPYLRMGKALGDLSLRSLHPHNRPGQPCPVETAPIDQSAETKEKKDSVWTSIVRHVQAHYPLKVLRLGFIQTEWIAHKKHNGLKVCVQVSETQDTKKQPSFDIKVTVYMDDACTLSGAALDAVKQDIKRPIQNIIRTSYGTPKA